MTDTSTPEQYLASISRQLDFIVEQWTHHTYYVEAKLAEINRLIGLARDVVPTSEWEPFMAMMPNISNVLGRSAKAEWFVAKEEPSGGDGVVH